MKNSFYSVSGIIKSYFTGYPVEGLKIRVFDKDFLSDQFLGEGVTNGAGYYKIEFSKEDFQKILKLERHPDVYILVYNQNNELIYTTNSCVVLNAGLNTVIDVNLKIESKDDNVEEKTYFFGERVVLKVVSKLKKEDLLNAYKLIRKPHLEIENKNNILQAFPDILLKHDLEKECGEGSGEAIRWFLKERNAEHLIDEYDLDNFESGIDVKEFYTTNIVVKYTIDSSSSDRLTGSFDDTPSSDQAFSLPDGTSLGTIRANLSDLHSDNTEVAPTYVQKVGLIAEYALSNFINAPFSYSDPRNGATRMEYRLLAQPSGIAGRTNQSWSHVEVDLDNSDTQNFFTVPHELFHQVQYRYNNAATRDGIYGILREGGARFNVESINDQPNRYVVSGNTIFNSPSESLLNEGEGVRNPIRYAAGLFWKYLAEQHSPKTSASDEPAIGVEIYRFLLEETTPSNSGYTIDGIREARKRMPWYGRFDLFRYYDAARIELDSHETTWGNYLIANYMHGLIQLGDSDYDARFDYLEDEDPVTFSTSIAKLADLQASVNTANQISIGRGDSISRNQVNHKPYAAVYYEITPNASSPRNLRIDFQSSNGMTDPLIQILLFESGETLKDIHKSDKTTYSKTINMSGIEKVVVIVGSKENGGDFSLNYSEVATNSDVMITRWNSIKDKEYQINPRGWAWHWISPDVMVDNDDNLLADTEVFFEQNNKLKVRLRNKGNSPANNIRVDFWYQKATPHLTATGWIPIEDESSTTQIITGETLNAGQEKWVTVNWAPANDGTDHNHWCVKTKVTSSGDSNTDNKLAFSNFNNVKVDTDTDFALLLRHPFINKFDKVEFFPRGPRFNFELLNPEIQVFRKKPFKDCNCEPSLSAEILSDLKYGKLTAVSDVKRERWNERLTTMPSENNFYYPVNQDSLPPGVNPLNLVTVAHIIDGEVVGGITYHIDDKEVN